jgi:hypothetical protein
MTSAACGTCAASKAAAGLLHVTAITSLTSECTDQRTAVRAKLPPFKAVMKQKTRGSAVAAGASHKYVDN